MKYAIILAMLALASCSDGKELPMVRSSDPVWQLNPGRWHATANDLIAPPEDGTPQLTPTPVRATANEAGL